MKRSTLPVRLSCAATLGIAGVCQHSLAQVPCLDVTLLAEDGGGSDLFGHAIAVRGDVMFIAAPQNDENGTDAGAVYVYSNEPDQGWVEVQKLFAADGEANDQFGLAGRGGIALSDDFAMIGAGLDDNENGTNAGAAYVFSKDEEGKWVQVQKIIAPGGGGFDFFGIASMDGNVAVIGGPQFNQDAPGIAHVYRYDGSEWVWEQELPHDPSGGADNFGEARMAGDLIVVGAHGYNGFSGALYIYRYVDGVWGLEQVITEDPPARLIGHHVAIGGDPARIITESGQDDGRGAVYVYCQSDGKDGPTWSREQILTASDRDSPDLLGWSLDIASDPVWRIVAGANNDVENGHQGGSAYEYRLQDGVWCCERKFRPPTDPNYARFGWALEIQGDTVLLGAPEGNNGAAYAYNLNASCGCPGDLDEDLVVGFGDLLVILAAWDNKGGPEDLDGSGTVDFGDVLVLLSSWGDCFPSGACCLPDGTCVEATSDACPGLGGNYRGVGTTCPADCEAPVGADLCGDATPLDDGTYQYSTLDATSGAPFTLPAECDEGNGVNFRNDVWVRYTASCDGVAVASVCDSNYDTRLAIYATDDCPGAFIACSDDACGEDGTQSEISFPVSAGAEYIIRIGASGSSTRGFGFLSIECAAGG